MAAVPIKDQILYFGSIVSLKLFGNDSYFMVADGYGTDKITFQDIDQHKNSVFSQTLFLVLPIFNNDNKKIIAKFQETLTGYNWTQKKLLTQELLENLMAEIQTNIEVSESNYTTPIKYNLSTFQLYHITSNRYLYLCPPDKASTASKLGLVDTPSTSTCWKFRNCLKYQIEGECLITYGSPLQLVSTFDFSGSYPALSCNSNSQKSILEPMCTLEGETELTVAFWMSEIQQLASFTHKFITLNDY